MGLFEYIYIHFAFVILYIYVILFYGLTYIKMFLLEHTNGRILNQMGTFMFIIKQSQEIPMKQFCKYMQMN